MSAGREPETVPRVAIVGSTSPLGKELRERTCARILVRSLTTDQVEQ